MTSAANRETGRGRTLAGYVAGARGRALPGVVVHEARRALVDHLAVTVSGAFDAAVLPVRRIARRWPAAGKARIVLGGTTTPAVAALINGTAAHAADFDDVHHLGAGHPGGPCWSTALALAGHGSLDEETTLAAFVAGFEVMARLGGGGVPGVGRSLQRKGFHPTSVVGRMGAASVAAVLYDLEAAQVLNALANAATTAGGLVGSFGTHGKPFHAGKAAMDGILAADLAAEGFLGADHIFERENGWLDAFIQDRDVEVPPLDFDEQWELLRNGYKLFASCRATHAASQTAIGLLGRIGGRPIERVIARVHPGALVTAGKTAPRTALEAKFSVSFCVAMALGGYKLAANDFDDRILADERVTSLLPLVEVVPVAGQIPSSAFVTVVFSDGSRIEGHTEVVLGHPENPVGDAGLEEKFLGLVEPVLGERKAGVLLEAAWNFGRPGTLAAIGETLAGQDDGARAA
ncbi:MAG: MmgE/PrpD family protein [Pseudochelatococcus sp.]|uniref:MmgE/PrpD family protein n=1 Tax=Pseudochelatococcus sp. TaxID=2020869 RepID=UPI003D8B2D9E